MSLESPSSHGRICSGCGSGLPLDAPSGNCPACLFALATGDEGPELAEARPRRFGSYELIDEIARGGMGIVWRARQDGLDRDVALKMILSGHLATSAQVVRFYTEARAAARLDHPGIVPIHEIGEEGGQHYYTMMLMEGRSLADGLRSGPLLSHERAARVVMESARALHYAHQRGVLHRDVKPSNILLDLDGKPRIGDFGLARLADADSGSTRSSIILGTPAYMAPEQAAGRPEEVTIAADVYGLGAVLHELLTGKPPFEGLTPLDTLRLLLETEPTPLRSRDPRIDRDLEVICLKCLQKRPEKRYASAGELANDLERWDRGEPIAARPVSPLERLASWARRKRDLATALAALFALLLAALAVTVALLIQVRRESADRAAALRAEEGQRLAFQSLAVARDNPGQALLLALEAAERAPSLSANNALLASLEACRERRRLLGHEHSVLYTRFSPDGQRVATSSYDKTARVWNVATGAAACAPLSHDGIVRTSVFSPDGAQVLTASDDATARLWDAASGRELRRLEGHEEPLRGAWFDPGGTRILTVGQQTALVWDARTGRRLHVLDGGGGAIACGRFSPDGSRIATGWHDGVARIWEAGTGSLLATLEGHGNCVYAVAFSADGRRIATGSRPEARVWSATTFEELSVARGHSNIIYAVDLTADGERLVTGSEDFTARIWDARTGEELHLLLHGHKVLSVELSRDGSVVLAASYECARLWDVNTGRILSELRGHAAPIFRASLSPDGRMAATASVDFTARIWTLRPEMPLALGEGARANISLGDIATDGERVVEAYRDDPSPRILERASGKEVARLEGHGGPVLAVRFSNAGTMIATASTDRTARLWDARDGRPIRTLSGHLDGVNRVVFSPDDRYLLTCSTDRSARLWSTRDGAPGAVYESTYPFRSVDFSSDGDRIALTDDESRLRIARISTGEVTIFEVGHPIVGAAFGPAGNEIALATGTTRAQIRSLADRAIIAELIQPARANLLSASPDRRWYAILTEDFTLRIWDALARAQHLEIKRDGLLPFAFHFTADSLGVVVSWAWMGRTEVVYYPLDQAAAARAASLGELTPDERDHFQVGTAEERRARRAVWTGGHIFGAPAGAPR